jgi:hypothetical protein
VQTTEAAATQRAREQAAVWSRRRGDEVEGEREVGLADEELGRMRTVSVGGGGGGTESAAAVEGRSQRRWRNRGTWGQEPWAVAVGDDIDLAKLPRISGSTVATWAMEGPVAKKGKKPVAGCRCVAGAGWSGME